MAEILIDTKKEKRCPVPFRSIEKVNCNLQMEDDWYYIIIDHWDNPKTTDAIPDGDVTYNITHGGDYNWYYIRQEMVNPILWTILVLVAIGVYKFPDMKRSLFPKMNEETYSSHKH